MTNGQYHSQSKRFRVALLVQTSSDWSREILAGVGIYAQQQGGWEFLLEPRGFRERLLLPNNWNGDGVICRLTDEYVTTSILNKRVPAVNVAWLGSTTTAIPQVISDEKKCAHVAAEFYHHKGFCSFGYIGPQASLGYSDDVLNAFRSQVRTLSTDNHFSAFPPFDCENLSEIREEVYQWILSLAKPAGIFAWSTLSASFIVSLCTERNLAIPDDIAILALEHEPLLCSLSPIPISSIEQLPHEVGYQAAAKLHRMMLGKITEENKLLVAPLGVDERLSTDTKFASDIVVQNAVGLIQQHFEHDLSIARIANELNVSRRSLEYRFRKCLNRTPAEELRRVRLRRVKQLLGSTHLSIEQIAITSGFKYPEAMIRTFKRELGLTPSQYRRQA